ncbi:MAG: hypothetical protein JKY94_10445 [Rhodobacteraceae bacterium]|nr:hypothetical protein [Paracoccaceae bacterium]
MTDQTKLKALEALLAKVVAGRATIPDFIASKNIVPGWHFSTALLAYNGSLDAAMKLHEAVLSGWEWCCGDTCTTLYDGELLIDGSFDDNPARAWLIVTIRALIAEDQAK